MNESLTIGFKRRLAAVFAAVFAVLAVSGAWRAIDAGDSARLVTALVVFGGLAGAFAAHALRRGPALVLDAEGLTDLRRNVVVGWDEIDAAHVAERRGGPGRCHDLVLDVAGRQLSLPLDDLTRRWSELAGVVERRLGTEVAVRREPSALARRLPALAIFG